MRPRARGMIGQPHFRKIGGDGGIRTLDTAFQPYNGLANRRLQPLGHVSGSPPIRQPGRAEQEVSVNVSAESRENPQRVAGRPPFSLPRQSVTPELRMPAAPVPNLQHGFENGVDRPFGAAFPVANGRVLAQFLPCETRGGPASRVHRPAAQGVGFRCGR